MRHSVGDCSNEIFSLTKIQCYHHVSLTIFSQINSEYRCYRFSFNTSTDQSYTSPGSAAFLINDFPKRFQRPFLNPLPQSPRRQHDNRPPSAVFEKNSEVKLNESIVAQNSNVSHHKKIHK